MAFAPSDAAAIERHRELTQEPGYVLGDWLWDTSYFYTPTAWLSSKRYATDQMVALNQTVATYWRRNRSADVRFPTAKVMIFERFDFNQTSRLTASGGRTRQSPGWNNPGAAPNVATADGSAASYPISRLEELAADGSTQNTVFRPSGKWDLMTSYLNKYRLGSDGLENGENETVKNWSYFWATRQGVLGRDLPR